MIPSDDSAQQREVSSGLASPVSAHGIGPIPQLIAPDAVDEAEPTQTVLSLKQKEPLFRDALRQQRKSWGAPFWREYGFYAANTHELLSLFLQHRLHPITHIQRLIVLLSCCAISLAYSYVECSSRCVSGFRRVTECRSVPLGQPWCVADSQLAVQCALCVHAC